MQIKNVRFIIAAITTFSAYAVYVSRVNLSIAIIAMVEDGHSNGSTTSAAAAAPIDAKQSNSMPIELSRETKSSSSNNSLLVHQQRMDDAIRLFGGPTFNQTVMSLASNESRIIHSVIASNTSSTTDSPKASQAKGDKLHKEPLTTIFPASKRAVKTPLISQEKFHWDQSEQGHILGAFFYGYIIFQIPGARMAESVGAKWIIMAANAGSAVVSLIFPIATQLNSIYLLLFLRFVMGLCQSAFFPAAYVLFCRWLPERERSILLPIMFIGSNMGSISTYIMSSYLISSPYGWPSVFYVSGLVCALVTVLWCVFGSNEPADNWLITEDERLFIEGNVCNQSSERNSLTNEQQLEKSLHLSNAPVANNINKVAVSNRAHFELDVDQKSTATTTTVAEAAAPAAGGGSQLSWQKLLYSVPVWTLIFSMYGNEWSNAVLCYELPTYLNTALDIPIEQNGVINSFFQLSYTLTSPIMSSLGAYMLDKRCLGMRKIHVRKFFQSTALFGQLVCFVSVPICGANRGLIIMLMFLAIVFKSCANAGDIMVAGDLSPEYAGTIFAFSNSIGNTAGVFVPLLAGSFVSNAYERDQWTPFWLTTAAIMLFSGLIFLIFGQTKRQNFNEDCGPHLRNHDDQDEEMQKMETTEFIGASLHEPTPRKLANGQLTMNRNTSTTGLLGGVL